MHARDVICGRVKKKESVKNKKDYWSEDTLS